MTNHTTRLVCPSSNGTGLVQILAISMPLANHPLDIFRWSWISEVLDLDTMVLRKIGVRMSH